MTETTPPVSPRDPILRVVPRPADINANGHIFGGWVLSQMDIAGGIVAGRIAQGAVATVAIESMEFIAPILLRDIISVYAHLERRGRTSMGIRIEVIATRDLTPHARRRDAAVADALSGTARLRLLPGTLVVEP